MAFLSKLDQMYITNFSNNIEFNDDFHPFIPGLEMKYAIEEAEKHNSKVVFGGLQINNSDLLCLKVLIWNY
jgi:hypothetical protein